MTTSGTEGSVAVWVFANLSFTAMRAQAKGSLFWKVVTFIFGFPGTLLTLMVVEEGSERGYGIDVPRKAVTPQAEGPRTLSSATPEPGVNR